MLVLTGAPGTAAAANHHCANEEAIAASKRIVVARELTETSDIYVTCWRRTNRHRVVAKFPAQAQQSVAFRMKGEWVVWRYRTGESDRMGSMNARTGRRGPAVDVPVQSWPLRLGATGGPVAQEVGDADVLRVFIASNGYYAWPVVGDGAMALYKPRGDGNDVRIDVGDGSNALRSIHIRGTTLRWVNDGRPKHARLGPLRAA